jgi:predicted MFS family arabinose efflux permease
MTTDRIHTTPHIAVSLTLPMMVTLFALGFTNLFLRGSLGILGPDLTAEMHLTPATLSIVASAFFFAYAAMQLPTGMLLDRFGPRSTLTALLLFTAAGAALFALSQSATGLIAARILMGIGCAGIFTGAFYVLNRWVQPHKVVVQSGVMNTVAALGGLCATTPLAALVAYLGWREAYWIFTAGVIVLLGLVALIIRDYPAGVAPPASKSEALADVVRGVAEVIRQPGMKRLIFIGIPLSAQSTMLGAWAAPYLRDVHALDPIARGNVLLAMAVCSMFGHVIMSALARALNSIKTVVIGGMCAIIFALTTMTLTEKPPLILVTALFCLMALSAMYPMLAFAQSRSLVPTHLVGRGLAVANMGIMTSIAISQLLFGWVLGLFPADAAGAPPDIAYRAGFGTLAVFSFIAGLIYAPIRDAKLRA